MSRTGSVRLSLATMISLIFIIPTILIAFKFGSGIARAFISPAFGPADDLATQIDFAVHGVSLVDFVERGIPFTRAGGLSEEIFSTVLLVSGDASKGIIIFGEEPSVRAVLPPDTNPDAPSASIRRAGATDPPRDPRVVTVEKPSSNCDDGCVCQFTLQDGGVAPLLAKSCVPVDLVGVSVFREAPMVEYDPTRMTARVGQRDLVNRGALNSMFFYYGQIPSHNELYPFMPAVTQLGVFRDRSVIVPTHTRGEVYSDYLVYIPYGGNPDFIGGSLPEDPIWPFVRRHEARYSPVLIPYAETGGVRKNLNDEAVSLPIYIEYAPSDEYLGVGPRLLVTPMHPTILQRKRYLFTCEQGDSECIGFGKNLPTGQAFFCEEQQDKSCKKATTPCSHGRITSLCVCGDESHNSGFCVHENGDPRQMKWYGELDQFSCSFVSTCEDYCFGRACGEHWQRHLCITDYCGLGHACSAAIGDVCTNQENSPNAGATRRIADAVYGMISRGPGTHRETISLSGFAFDDYLIGFSSGSPVNQAPIVDQHSGQLGTSFTETYYCPFEDTLCRGLLVGNFFPFFSRNDVSVACRDSSKACLCTVDKDIVLPFPQGETNQDVISQKSKNLLSFGSHIACEPVYSRETVLNDDGGFVTGFSPPKIVFVGDELTHVVSLPPDKSFVRVSFQERYSPTNLLFPGVFIDQAQTESLEIEVYVPEILDMPVYVRIVDAENDRLDNHPLFGRAEGFTLASILEIDA